MKEMICELCENIYDTDDETIVLCPMCVRDINQEDVESGEVLQEREKGDDDGVEYADPRDEKEERER